MSMKLINFYIILILINIVRGVWVADGYWDFKGLINNSMALLLPIFAYLGTNTKLVKNILILYFKYALVIFVLLLVILPKTTYGYYLVPITLMALFFQALSTQSKLLILIFTAIVIFADLSARSNVIKFVVPLVLGCIYYFRFFFTARLLNHIRISFFIMPCLLLALAATGTFNVFKMDEYINASFSTVRIDNFGDEKEQDLLADTRSFLYVEALYTAEYYDSWLFGRSPARGTISTHFGNLDMNGRGERIASEVAILNIFNWLGFIGVLFYVAIFYIASYLAVCKSNNYYSKILGLFIAFRWSYAWVEDFTIFSLTYLSLWLMIGMCYSKQFRGMNDSEFVYWVRGIFDKRYKLT